MSNQHKHKKQILLDPLAVLPDVDNATTQFIIRLHQSYQSARQQHTDISSQLKATSRKIGEAKSKNLPIDKFKSKMRELGNTLKPVSAQVIQLEGELLDCFTRLDLNNSDNTDSSEEDKPTSTHHYKSSAPRNISIKTIAFDADAARLNIISDWNDYASKHPAGTMHHQVGWRSVFARAYNHKSYYYYACTSNNKIVGVLPVTRLTSQLFGDQIVSMPFFQRGGAIADSVDIENRLILFANKDAENFGVTHIEYRDDISRDAMPVQTHKVNMILTLTNSHDVLWDRFSSKLRAQIRRAQRESPVAHIGRLEYLDDFYKVYTRNMRDLGSPCHSKKFIRTILEQFSDTSWIVVIHHNQKAVAAALLLSFNKTMEIPLASTIREANPLSINMFLYWEVLKFAISKSCQKFDFGRSSIDAGTYRFKQQWGAKPMQLYWHYWLSPGAEIPTLNPSNPKYALIIYVWKHLPVCLTRWIGPMLVKNIP